ncbi:hypothetical protein BsWGS_04303 [Bradybaena similaris]
MDVTDKTDKVSNISQISVDSGFLDCSELKNVADDNNRQPEGQLSHEVFFVVGDNKHKFGAHKKILQNASNIFRDLLQAGDESKSEVHLPDVSADAFRELLRHIYSADEQLNINNVMSVLRAADSFQLPSLRETCRAFLHKCLEINSACKLLAEARLHECLAEEKIIISFLEKNLRDVLQTKGIECLSRSLLNEVLTLPGTDVKEILMKQAAERWARNQCVQRGLDVSDENIMKCLHGCFYVDRDSSNSHRYVMDSVTSRNLLENQDETGQKLPKTGSLSTVSSTASLRSTPVPMLNRRFHMWPDLHKVTRLQEESCSDINDGIHADAISFTVSHNVYLYGFSIYGPRKHQVGRYQVDSILQRKKKVIIMETTVVKGAGVTLPVMLEKPVRIEKNIPYTLEMYIKGPESYSGTKGLAQVQGDPALFTFSNAVKVKTNRSDVSKGQIPQFYFFLQ